MRGDEASFWYGPKREGAPREVTFRSAEPRT
jgi:hypothetical protein